MDVLDDIIEFYKKDNIDKHKILYNVFNKNAEKFMNGILVDHFNRTHGCGELAFSWSWYTLVKSFSKPFKFLEIGVYKGRVISLIQLLSNLLHKDVQIFGVTPLSNSGDKYSSYENIDYLAEISKSFTRMDITFDNTTIIKGFSQDNETLEKIVSSAPFDIIFIDGCHDYDVVCLDINNYSNMLSVGGYLVLDDASLSLDNPYGQFLGHPDVAKAIDDILVSDKRFIHLYAVGHNRIWKKIMD